MGIARRCADDHLRGRGIEVPTDDDALFDGAGGTGPADLAILRLDWQMRSHASMCVTAS